MRVQAFKVNLKTPNGEEVIDCAGDQYILDAAEQAGLDLSYSCRTGACGFCVGKVEAGEVDQSEQTCLNDSQIGKGFVLMCVAHPMSDGTIITHQEADLYY